MNRSFQWLPILCCLLILSCSKTDGSVGGQCGQLATSFFRQPVKAQLVEFSAYGIERQYDVFICGNEYMEPPAQYLAEPLAKRGKSAVPFLKIKLETTRNQRAIRYIVSVFSEMSWRKTYDVRGDAELMQLMKIRTMDIQDEFWRKFTLNMIADIDTGK